MTEAGLLIGTLVIALLLVVSAALALKQRRRRQARPVGQQPMPGHAAPSANPLLHDATLLGPETGQPASDGRAGAVSHISVVAGASQQTYTLYAGRPVMIGRHSSHEITLKNHRVSRDHARLVLVHDGKVQISDLGSTNGTFVRQDKRRLAPNTQEVLAPGDVFWIGPDVEFVVGAAQETGTPKNEHGLA
jgi:pSer/pThr/pTyr-binding forkhead associated (FHA) protein